MIKTFWGVIRENRAIFFHFFCQVAYICIGLTHFHQPRPWPFFSIYLFSILTQLLLWKFSPPPFSYPWLSFLGATNSVFINLDSPYPSVYCLAIFIGLSFKHLFRNEKRHYYNPSAIAIFVIALTMPSLGSSATYAWSWEAWLPLVPALLGPITAWLAGRLTLSLTYLVSAMIVSWVCGLVLPLRELASAPPMLWPTSFLSIGSLIFTFHVVNDPKTSPASIRAQLLYGTAVGAMDGIMKVCGFMNTAFMAYIFVQTAYGLMHDRRIRDTWRIISSVRRGGDVAPHAH